MFLSEHKSTLLQYMAWRRWAGDEPLVESNITQFTNACMRRPAWFVLGEKYQSTSRIIIKLINAKSGKKC